MVEPRQFGFVVKNQFQAMQMAELCRAVNGTFVCQSHLASELQTNYVDIKIEKVLDRSFKRLDGCFDVLVSHTLFKGCHELCKTRLAMIQYGYAKSNYNDGNCLALSGVNLVYGPHAANAIIELSQVREVGHPMYNRIPPPNSPSKKHRSMIG